MSSRSEAAVQPSRGNMRVHVASTTEGRRTLREDFVSIEEPLEIRLNYSSSGERIDHTIAITMRTPGDDFDLAAGFLLGEGVVRRASEIEAIAHCGSPSPDKRIHNVVNVRLADGCRFDPDMLQRHFYTTSSCGICGKTSLAAVKVRIPDDMRPASFQVSNEVLHALPNRLRTRQSEFEKTGGLHASATFDRRGKIRHVREDVGRHNALDKLVGSYVRRDALDELREMGLLLSGRASFELIQKAGLAGIPLVAAIGPPSSLAIELAMDLDITLVGFLRARKYNLYCGNRVTRD